MPLELVAQCLSVVAGWCCICVAYISAAERLQGALVPSYCKPGILAFVRRCARMTSVANDMLLWNVRH